MPGQTPLHSAPRYRWGVLPLIGTAILAGASVAGGFDLGPRVPGGGGEVGAATVAVGFSAAGALLAWCWCHVATRMAHAMAAAAGTVLGAVILTVAVGIAVAASVDDVVCRDEPYPCGLDIYFLITTVGLTSCWIVAGAVSLAVMVRHSPQPQPQSQAQS